MSDRIEQRGRRAGAAVHARTDSLDPERGLDDVVRRGRRPRPSATVAVVLVLLVAVPAGAWLLSDTRRVEFDEPPADAPATPGPDPSPAEPPAPADDEPAGEPGAQADDAPPPPGPSPLPGFGTDAVTSDGFPTTAGEVALLTDVRVAGHEGFDRIVLEFDGPDTPGYRVAYVDTPVEAGSGEPVTVDGEVFLEITLTPASGVDLSGETYEQTYHGPDRLRGDTAVVTEVVGAGDYEATLTWVAGLRAKAPFSVTVLDEPLRLVVDVRTD